MKILGAMQQTMQLPILGVGIAGRSRAISAQKRQNLFMEVKQEQDKTKTKEEQTEESFTIPGQDLTGRNVALRTWNKRGIGTTIKNGYKLLDNAKDRKIFFDYLLTNLKLYFDKFEKELQGTVPEPTTQAYEKIKQTGQSYEAGGGGAQAPLAEGKKRRRRLVESKKLYDQIITHLLR